jgi:hypothetical protein
MHTQVNAMTASSERDFWIGSLEKIVRSLGIWNKAPTTMLVPMAKDAARAISSSLADGRPLYSK